MTSLLGEVVQLRPREQPIPDAAPGPGEKVRNESVTPCSSWRARHWAVLRRGRVAHLGRQAVSIDAETIAATDWRHHIGAAIGSGPEARRQGRQKSAIKWAITTGTSAVSRPCCTRRVPTRAHEQTLGRRHLAAKLPERYPRPADNNLRPHNPADSVTKICGTVTTRTLLAPAGKASLPRYLMATGDGAVCPMRAGLLVDRRE